MWVPEAEPVVGGFRARFDATSVARGIVPHVTVLFPFVPAAEIDAVSEDVAAHVRRLPGFDAALVAVRCFPEHVWLAPEPRARWVDLIEATCARYPDIRPYEGAVDSVEPHLTVGAATESTLTATIFTAAERELTRHLPLRFRVDTVSLLEEQADGTWVVAAQFPLA